MYILSHATVCIVVIYFIRFLFFAVCLLYAIVRMNMYVMFLLRQQRLNKLIIIIIRVCWTNWAACCFSWSVHDCGTLPDDCVGDWQASKLLSWIRQLPPQSSRYNSLRHMTSWRPTQSHQAEVVVMCHDYVIKVYPGVDSIDKKRICWICMLS